MNKHAICSLAVFDIVSLNLNQVIGESMPPTSEKLPLIGVIVITTIIVIINITVITLTIVII